MKLAHLQYNITYQQRVVVSIFCLSDYKSARDYITPFLLFRIIAKSNINTASPDLFLEAIWVKSCLLVIFLNAVENKRSYLLSLHKYFLI